MFIFSHTFLNFFPGLFVQKLEPWGKKNLFVFPLLSRQKSNDEAMKKKNPVLLLSVNFGTKSTVPCSMIRHNGSTSWNREWPGHSVITGTWWRKGSESEAKACGIHPFPRHQTIMVQHRLWRSEKAQDPGNAWLKRLHGNYFCRFFLLLPSVIVSSHSTASRSDKNYTT